MGIKFSNMYGIQSQSLIDALINDDYDLKSKPSNVYSLTEVIAAPKEKVLWRRHEDEITIDVSDRLHTLLGSAKHYILEQSNKQNGRLSEERLYIDTTTGDVHTLPDPKKGESIKEQLKACKWYSESHYYVSCKIDVYDHTQECLEDYKGSSVYKAKRECDPTWEAQVNCGGYGMRMIGFLVNRVRVVLLPGDWSAAKRKEAERSAEAKGVACDYPPIKAKEFNNIRVWSDEECITYLRGRVKLHVAASKLKDDDIPVCTPEERWYKGDSYAIMKKGNQKATKVVKGEDYEDAEEAKRTAEILLQQYMDERKKKTDEYFIEFRPGNDGHCNGDVRYCHVCQWCNYWQQTYKDKISVETEY